MRQTLLRLSKKREKLLASKEFDEVRGEEIAPGKSIQSDEDLLEYIRRTSLTVYHPVGTCKMGTDDLAVVSPSDLKVKGMSNLRVIDASIMPSIVSGNTSAPTMMIAEQGARMILNGIENMNQNFQKEKNLVLDYYKALDKAEGDEISKVSK